MGKGPFGSNSFRSIRCRRDRFGRRPWAIACRVRRRGLQSGSFIGKATVPIAMAAAQDTNGSRQGHTDDEIRAVGEALADAKVDRITPARTGGNNRIYRLDCAGAAYALKFYPPQDDDRRDRLGAEYAAMSFLFANGMDRIARPVAVDAGRHCALYEWIEGDPVDDVDDGDIDALIRFLIDIQDLREATGADDLRAASAGCPRPEAVVRQFRDRLSRFREIAPEYPDLLHFLDRRLDPIAATMTRRLLDDLEAAGIEPDRELARRHLALSPSDFGFHNAIRRGDGSLVFIDFEYFGWDDPAKMIADVMLHPGMALNDAARELVAAGLVPFFDSRDDGFNRRFRLFLPVCGLIWCLILLNEFLPERWARRNLSGRIGDAGAAQKRQLAKAAAMLDRVEEEFG
jgi:hypothetical protein